MLISETKIYADNKIILIIFNELQKFRFYRFGCFQRTAVRSVAIGGPQILQLNPFRIKEAISSLGTTEGRARPHSAGLTSRLRWC